MNKLRRGFIGFVTLFITITIASGDITTAVQVFAVSIICTAGMGLIFWILLSVVVGSIVEAIFQHFSKKNSVSNENSALLNYIQNARSNGLAENQIAQKLLSAGWPKDAISKKLNI